MTHAMPSPPRLAGLLLRRLVRRDLLEFIEGDLNEEFARRSTGNRGAAHCWYWREAVTAALMMPRRRSGVRSSSTKGDRQMTKLVRDLRFGARALIKSPGYALVVTLTVALAIGANTVIFSFANPFLVKPLPIVDQKNLAFVYSVDPQRGMPRGRSSYLDYLDWRARLRSFTALSAWTDTNVTLTDRREAQRLQARVVTPSLFRRGDFNRLPGGSFATATSSPADRARSS